MADTKHKLKKYKQYLESNPDGDKVLSVLNKLDALPVSISLLQDTGIGKLVNGFRKKSDGIGTVAKSIVNKWKNLVAEEAKKATKLDSDDEQEYVPEPPKTVKYEASYNPTSKSQSEDEYCPKHVAEEYTPEDVKYKPTHRAVNKYAKYSNEKYSPQHTSSNSSSKQKYVPTKIPSAENSENETYSPSRINDDPLPYSPQQVSDNSEEEAYDQATPEQNDSEPDEYNPTNNEASPTGASYTPTPKYDSDRRHKSSSAKSEKHSSKSAKSLQSDGHKSRNGSLHSSSKNEGSHSSSKNEKHSSNSKSEKHSSNAKSEKHSSKHKSHDEKHSKSDKHSSKHSDNEKHSSRHSYNDKHSSRHSDNEKHSSKHSDNEKHSSRHSDNDKHSKSQNGSHTSKSKEVPNGKHPSSSSSHKDKKSSSSSVKASSSLDKKSGDKSSVKHSSHSDRKSSNSVKQESPSKSKLDKNRNEKRKISKIQPFEDSFDLFSPDDSAVVKRVKVDSKPKVNTASKSSKDSHKHSKHQSSSSSSSKPKEERLDKKDSTSKSSKHKEERLEKHDKHSKSKSSSSSKGEKRKVKVEESLDDDATDGFSFDDFLNCDVKAPKKKLKTDKGTSGSPWSSSLSKPSTSKMGTRESDDAGFTVPKPSKQKLDIVESDILSLLPETSAVYRPLPTRSLEDEKKHSLATFDPMVIGTKQGKRTQVYSGRKHGLSEMKSLFSQCIQVLMDNIDAIDYVGGVPYDILKPVLERCSVQQLYRLEDLNPHFVGEDEELWATHCEKEFKNQEPDEMESWREFYLRLVEERESRLEKLRTNMNRLQAAKPKSRQVQLAYVDSYVKPPRDVMRKQQRYGTGKVVSASNSIQSTSRGGRASFSHNISIPQPKAVKPVAPMMQKINKMLAKRRR